MDAQKNPRRNIPWSLIIYRAKHCEYVRWVIRNATINSGVTGFALDLGIIDDYIKDRNEANSKGARDKTWGWMTDVFMPRFSAKSPRRTSMLIVTPRVRG